MSYGQPEKVQSRWPKGVRKFLKKAAVRLLRRKAKETPENAPRKPRYRG